MPLKYNVIEIFTSEETRWHGRPVWDAIVNHVRKSGIAARCIVNKGFAGCYENGEVSSNSIETLSFNMPLKIEVILPAAELDTVLPAIEEMVSDGIVVVEDMEVRAHRTSKRLIPRQLRVRDAMTPAPKTVSEATPVHEVIHMLLSNEFNGVPVVDAANRPVGVITQGDLISRAGMPVRLGLLAQLDEPQVDEYLQTLSGKTAGQIMTRPVTTIQEEKRLGEAVDAMLKNRLKRLPVVNSSGELVGLIARSDVFHTITRETPDWRAIKTRNVSVGNATFVRDVMRRDTDTVLPDAPVEAIVKIIDNSDIQRVAVVDNEGRLLGLISDSDILGLFSEHRAGLWDYLVRRLSFAELTSKNKQLNAQTGAGTASDVMKTELVTVREDTPIENAIELMSRHKIKRLPVVDENGVFKGLVSRDSVLRAGVQQK